MPPLNTTRPVPCPTPVRTLATILALLAPATLLAQSPAGVPGAWSLTFQEEFASTTLDGAKWRMGLHAEGSNGQHANSHKSISVDTANGRLRLTALNQPGSQAGEALNYLSGEISTFSTVTRAGVKQGFAQKEGYFEARIKHPAGVQGLWPAFWLMPDRGAYGNTHNYQRGFLRFDLSAVSLPAITSAKLRLKVAAIEDTTPTTNKNNTLVFGVANDTWTETGAGSVTWNNMPVHDPEYLDQHYNNTTVGSTVELDVTAFVQAQVAASDKRFSFLLADTFMKTNRVTYHSREATTAGDRPVLVINGSATHPVTVDATVKSGTAANTNHGGAATLEVRDDWGNTASTGITGTDQRGMEIDIMEYLGVWGPNTMAPALHWDGYTNGVSNASKGFGHLHHPATSDNFHTYGLYWKGTTLEFYIDGGRVAAYTDSRVINVPAYIILSHQLGGWDGNSVVGSTIHNRVMEVDWVRVWSGTRTADPADRIVDNTTSGYFTASAGWTASSAVGGYYGSNYVHDGNAGKGSRTFDFNPGSTLPGGNGDFLVFARWPASGTYSTNTPFVVTQSNWTTQTTRQNQTANGGQWIPLGLHPMFTSNAKVRVSNADTSAHVIADAVRFRRFSGANVVYVDNGQTQTARSHPSHWVASTSLPGYLGSNLEHDNNANKGSAAFRFKPGKALPAVGSAADYLVYARWTASGNRATNVPYDIKRADGSIVTVTVNQQLNNNEWVPLGLHRLDETSDVLLRNAGTTGYVIADAVRFVPATP